MNFVFMAFGLAVTLIKIQLVKQIIFNWSKTLHSVIFLLEKSETKFFLQIKESFKLHIFTICQLKNEFFAN